LKVSLARILLPILLALAFVARWEPTRTSRLEPFERDLGASQWLIDDPNTCAHLRRIELAIAGDKVVVTDRFLNHPSGGEVPALPLLDTIVAGVAQRFLRSPTGDVAMGGVDEAKLEDLVVQLAPILGLLAVLATWWAARYVVAGPRGDVAALLACATVALHPVTVGVSSAGTLDGAVLGCVMFALLVRSVVRSLSSDSMPTSLLDALVAGALAGLLVACTAIGFALFLPAWGAFVLRAWRSRDEARANALRSGLFFCLVAAFLASIPLSEGPWEESQGVVRGWVSGVSMILFLSSAPLIVMMLTQKSDKPRAFRTACFVVALIAMAWQLPKIVTDLGPGVRWFLSQRSLVNETLATWPNRLAPQATYLVAVPILIASWFVLRGSRRELVTQTLFGFALVTVVLVPVTPLAAPYAVVAVACLAARVFDVALDPERGFAPAWPRAAAVTLSGVLLAAGLAPYLDREDPALREERIDFVAGLRWMRATTESGGPWNSSQSSGAWGVHSSLHDGALVQYHARRPAVVSPWAVLSGAPAVQESVAVGAREPAAFVRWLQGQQVRYVVVPGRETRWDMDRRIAAQRASGPAASLLHVASREASASGSTAAEVAGMSRVYASVRRVGPDGRAPRDGGTGEPVISIWHVPTPPSLPEAELRAR